MKTLKSILEASILADIDDQLESGDEYIKEQIRQFIKDNYVSSVRYYFDNIVFSENPNKDGKYEVSVNVHPYNIKLREGSNRNRLTNDLFVWGDVTGTFICSNSKITTLEGAPKNVIDGCFSCSNCKNLKSLKGLPERIDKDLHCYNIGVSLLKHKISKISHIKGQIYY